MSSNVENLDKFKHSKKNGVKLQQEWNDAISDLDRLKLSKEEQVKKNESRLSHNQVIARAELIERTKLGTKSQPFSPLKSSKLRSNASKTMEQAMADGTVAIKKAQKIRGDLKKNNVSKVEEYFRNEALLKEVDSNGDGMGSAQHVEASSQPSEGATEIQDEEERLVVSMRDDSVPRDGHFNGYPLSPLGKQNLNNTIQLMVKTCEALWQQLEEERMNRERLHFQLQEQRNIITTLTSELLQVQQHQEIILQELQVARAAQWGYSDDYDSPRFQGHESFQGLYDGSKANGEDGRLSSLRTGLGPDVPEARPTSAQSGPQIKSDLDSELLKSRSMGLSQSSSHLEGQSDDYRSAFIRDRIEFNNARMRFLREAAAHEQPAGLSVFNE